MSVRTRIEPSPSGSIHVGNARTALYNWLLARQSGGSFVLRIADTDKDRVTDEGLKSVVEDLRWLGLRWDEGPEVGGDHGPYHQSARYPLYDEAAARLVRDRYAYRCYCSPEELEQRRAQAQAQRQTPGYDGRCRHLSEEERAAFEAEGRASAIRFKVPDGTFVAFTDVVRGLVETASDQIPDFVIRRSDGSPTYMLAVTVDDLRMGITHVIRGEDLLPATPRQILLREALGVTQSPVFAHLPLIVDERGRPLSKRWGDVAVRGFREQGFLPEAMVNYLALLGWSYDDKTNVFSTDELIERFSLERVGKNPAAFDVAKLEWLNGHYIRSLPPAELAARLVPFCVAAGFAVDTPEGRLRLRAVAPLLGERLKRLTEVPPMIRFLFEDVEPDDKARTAVEGQQDYLRVVRTILSGVEKWTSSAIEDALRGLADDRQLKPKQAFQPVRAAVTGMVVSPPLFESLEILGRERTLARLGRVASATTR